MTGNQTALFALNSAQYTMNSSKAFTLPELLIATTVILLTSLSILFSYIQCLEINDANNNSLTALQASRNLVETIKASSFETIHNTFHKKTFPLEVLNGINLVEIDDRNPDLLIVSVKCFWKSNKGRQIGEDKNLNGSLDQGEDINENQTLDSPVELLTYISKQ